MDLSLTDGEIHVYLMTILFLPANPVILDASKMVQLMDELDQVTKHMKFPIKATLFVPTFVQFLTPAQKSDLKLYEKEVAEAEAKASVEEEKDDELIPTMRGF